MIIKTNADDGLFDGALIFTPVMVDITIGGYPFRVATSIQTGHDPDCDAGEVFRPSPRAAKVGTNTHSAEAALLDAPWVPATSDDAQDEVWYAHKLETIEGVRLDPKNVGKLLTNLYEAGISYLPAKSGKNGSKKKFWRERTGDVHDMSIDDLDSLDDDLDDFTGGQP